MVLLDCVVFCALATGPSVVEPCFWSWSEHVSRSFSHRQSVATTDSAKLCALAERAKEADTPSTTKNPNGARTKMVVAVHDSRAESCHTNGPTHRAISWTTITADKPRLPSFDQCLLIASVSGRMTPFVSFLAKVRQLLNSKYFFRRMQKPPEDVDKTPNRARRCRSGRQRQWCFNLHDTKCQNLEVVSWEQQLMFFQACCCEQRDNTESPWCLGELLEWR